MPASNAAPDIEVGFNTTQTRQTSLQLDCRRVKTNHPPPTAGQWNLNHKRDVAPEGEKDSEQSPYSSTLNQPQYPPRVQETWQNETLAVTFS